MSDNTKLRGAYFEHFSEDGQPGHRVPLRSSPFRVGRNDMADHRIYSRRVSGLHAEVVAVGDRFLVRDLGSTNGTFINGTRVREGWIGNGDVLHIAHYELRFTVPETDAEEPIEPTIASNDDDHLQLFRETTDLILILERRGVSAVFQPIVGLADRRTVAYETLGRVAMPGMTYNVGELFRIAGKRGAGAKLSQMMREVALGEVRRVPESPVSIFCNLHPSEMAQLETMDAALRSIAEGIGEGQTAVLEIHEAAVTDPAAMTRIRERLDELGIRLAYDDFGAGQSRLMELIEVPPDYLKLDMALVHDIDRSEKRQELVRALVHVMHDLGIAVLAEGVERVEEGETCRDLGCILGQGYYYGRPSPL